MNPWFKVRSLLKKNVHCHRTILSRLCSTSRLNGDMTVRKMEDFFFNPKVQSILRKITGLDYEKIFKPAQQELSTPTYEFVTEKRLKELQEKAHIKALEKLQMPPIMNERKPCEEFLCKNPELQGFLDSKLVFTDISQEATCRERMITVRELDGTLRTANWEERFRMNQIFFPIPGRNFIMPELFNSPHLDKLLEEESYIFILDLACVQFEPDDLNYHKVIDQTFQHISERKKFHDLRSTRHFGPMAFYFSWKNNIEPLLFDMIERKMMNDASDTVRLLHMIHPHLETSLNLNEASDLEIVQEFIQKNSTEHKGLLELIFDSYLESQEKSAEVTNPESVAV